MAQIEPMDIDSIGGVFDDKENSLQNSNVLPRTPCTEKGYEELDVSELNMKLRYSITPASSPMSKSFTANCKDNKTFNLDEDSLNSTIVNENTSLTRSLNSTITKFDVSKSSKLPLQSLPTDQFIDNMKMHRSLENDPDITITINGTYSLDENLSSPSTSSSTTHTPEATTPTKDIPKDGGSPIMRGLKSVLNMFRTSQSPIPTEDNTPNKDSVDYQSEEGSHHLASTPKTNNVNKENNLSKRTSPLKDSVVFNEDLERELQWKDDSDIIFKDEKIPIHKLFLQKSTSLALEKIQSRTENLNSTVEYMDISYNDSVVADKIMTDISNANTNYIECTSGVESEGEFLDCETSYTKKEHVSEQDLKIAITDNERNDYSHQEINDKSAIQIYEPILENLSQPELITERCPKQENLNNSITDIQQNNQLVKETTLVLPEIHNNLKEHNETVPDIKLVNMNVTKDLNISDSINKQLDTSEKGHINTILSEQNDETKILNYVEEEDKLSSTLPCGVNEEIDLLEEKPLNATIPLNIVTDQDNNVYENKDDSNIMSIEKCEHNNLLQGSHEAVLSVGILQICTRESENNTDDNNVHEHVHTPKVTDVESTTLILAEDTTKDKVGIGILTEEQAFNEKTQELTVLSVTNNEENHVSIKEIKTENVDNSKQQNSQHLENKLGTTRSDLNLFKKDKTSEHLYNVINDTEIIEIKSENCKNNEINTTPLNSLPSDIPLPNDEDIENEDLFKHSLTDKETCVINNTDEIYTDTFTHVLKENTLDLLDAMNELCEGPINKRAESLNKINSQPTKVPFDDIPIAENMTNKGSLQKEMLSNETNILLESKFNINNELETLVNPSDASILLNKSEQESTLPENNSNFTETVTEIKHVRSMHESQVLTETAMDVDIPNIYNSEKEKDAKCNVNDVDILKDVILKENKTDDEEIVTSASNSPFVSVNDLNLPTSDIDLDQIEAPFETKCKMIMSPPISPKLSRKGYNVNFDEIDDPFATKTNIRMSPTPEIVKCPDETANGIQNKTHIQKKTQQNRRKSQPERQKRDLTKNRFNNSYCNKSQPTYKDKIRVPSDNNTNQENKFQGKKIEIKLNCPTILPVLKTDETKPFEVNKCEVDELGVIKEPALKINKCEVDELCVVNESAVEIHKCELDKVGVINETAVEITKCEVDELGVTNEPEDKITKCEVDELGVINEPAVEITKCEVNELGVINEPKVEITKCEVDELGVINEPAVEITKCEVDELGVINEPEVEITKYEVDELGVINEPAVEITKCEVDELGVINEPTLFSDEVVTKDQESNFSKDVNNTFNTIHNQHYSYDEEFPVKNVFNLPEIDDINFNPFVTKSKMRMTPSPTFQNETIKDLEIMLPEACHEVPQQQPNSTVNFDNSTHDVKVEISSFSNETCSSKATDKELTVREIHTEDEDTAEGPFLETEDFADVVKVTDFGTGSDMMQFEDFHTEIENGNKEEGEIFIDAEAFEFLLNQNKSNVVADSGKESLFLKFDPLFAKRVSSDGVLAALNRIQKRQSTPKKPPAPVLKNVIDEEKTATSSNNESSVMEDNSDETNVNLTKPMMVVSPAINSRVSPRKSTTPPRINRRSLTFTSPAIAVIDRLLSLSGNSSTLDHEATTPRQNREYNETDIALTQLRELLAEKEINVHNLRCESKELKDRLATMESQVKTLEKESEVRLKKVNDLNDRIAEKTKINKSMAVVVEEYERTIASLIANIEQEKRSNAEERSKLIGERDEQTAHLASMEVSFSDLHSKYEKSKQIILSMKANEDTYKKSIKEFDVNLVKMQNNYELLKQHATSKLNHANQELEKFNKAHESEVLKLNAMIKRKELHITSLEESLAQKTKANEELTAICDELINKVG